MSDIEYAIRVVLFLGGIILGLLGSIPIVYFTMVKNKEQ